MHRLLLSLFSLTILFFPTGWLYAQSDSYLPSFEIPNARAAAMGGFHAALPDDFSASFFNPAGFAAVRTTAAVSEITLEINSIETLYNMFFGEASGLELIKLITERIDANAVFLGPFSFGKVHEGWGWRFFNATRFNVFWSRDDIFVFSPKFSEEFVYNIGYGYRLMESGDETLDIGITGKLFYRLTYDPHEIFIQEAKHTLAEMDEKPYTATLGGGFDAGLRWTRNNTFSVGLNFKDFFTRGYVTEYRNIYKYFEREIYDSTVMMIKPHISLGFALRLKSPIMHRWNTDLILTTDYHGLLELMMRDYTKSPLLFFTAGFELRFLEVISLRAGWAEWHPAGGLGINFTAFQLDLSVFGKTQGNTIDARKTIVINLGFLFHYY
ncbi:MAG: hypothetical protein LBD22_03495 [Spirochaetaceae bacterium]|nr:hypothetical protein [Spirochaetaceae bacterium]